MRDELFLLLAISSFFCPLQVAELASFPCSVTAVVANGRYCHIVDLHMLILDRDIVSCLVLLSPHPGPAVGSDCCRLDWTLHELPPSRLFGVSFNVCVSDRWKSASASVRYTFDPYRPSATMESVF